MREWTINIILPEELSYTQIMEIISDAFKKYDLPYLTTIHMNNFEKETENDKIYKEKIKMLDRIAKKYRPK